MIERTGIPIVAALFMLGCRNDDWKTTDKVEVIQEEKSPDGRYVATVFTCSGGGAAGYTYTNVNLRKTADNLNQRDFLLGEHQWNSFTDIELSWRDSKHLEVSYRWLNEHPEEREMNGEMVSEKQGIQVSYVLEEDGRQK